MAKTVISVDVKCQLCKDHGWVIPRLPNGKPDWSHPKRCVCMKDADIAKKQESFRHMCELPDDTEDRILGNFKVGKEDTLKLALQASWDVVNGNIKFLTLMSPVDRGKTHLAIGICREWMKSGKTAKYAYVPDLMDELREGFQVKGEFSYASRFNFYKNVQLLVLDDMGAEVKTEWAIEKLENIINHRYINNFSTVVTTNKPLSYQSERIRSRLERAKLATVVIIKAPEYNTVKKGGLK